MDERIGQGVIAGLTAGVIGGIPSTTHAVLKRTPVLQATKAAGALALPNEHRPAAQAAAGIPVHLTISVAWGVALSFTLPRRRTVLWGAVAGAAIAAGVYQLPWHRSAPVRKLPFWPQLADHVVFGATVAHVVKHTRAHVAKHTRPNPNPQG